ncbi:MAG: LamG domain-containing protein [Deltaproteobacteria bacterium]|nr:LamG domain-containing protein [Deltaproteobacteria bacterium]MDQ3298312.1 LamG domain-containing protein [Myxococcota bacterium]
MVSRAVCLAWLAAVAACGRIGIDPVAIDAPPDVDTPPPDLTLGLVAHYAMEGAPLDGARDSSGNQLDGTCGGTCPGRGPGQIGLAATFDNTAYYVVNDDALLRPSAFTVALWLRRRSGPGVTPVVKPQVVGTGASWELVTFAGRTNFCTDIDPGAQGERCTNGPPLVLGAWSYVAMTWDGVTKRLLIDGVEVAKEVSGTVFDTSAMMIGADRQDGVIGEPYSGDIDELRIYDRALDDATLAALFTLR